MNVPVFVHGQETQSGTLLQLNGIWRILLASADEKQAAINSSFHRPVVVSIKALTLSSSGIKTVGLTVWHGASKTHLSLVILIFSPFPTLQTMSLCNKSLPNMRLRQVKEHDLVTAESKKEPSG